MKHILFVCSGNTCRSSMAEGIFNSIIAADDELREHVTSSSAGIAAFGGDLASSNSIKVLKEEFGVDITFHRSRMVEYKMLQDADFILTMTREHKRVILSKYPGMINKIFTLKEFALDYRSDKNTEEYNFAIDIADPFGMPVNFYKLCAEEIKEAIEKMIFKLKKSIFL